PGMVRLAVDPAMPTLIADAAQLERAFANLLENALRYAGEQPVNVSVRRLGSRLVVRVSDRGPGIPAGEQELVFEPFYRGSHAGALKGTGLGLAIAKGFVEANGGVIGVESLPGQGTSLVVSFPA
ncbi:MAG: sensor histidine kinase, partial [Solirubrobacteraceae bacterium]